MLVIAKRRKKEMTELKRKIIEASGGNVTEEKLCDKPTSLAFYLAIYAHMGQVRENGERYFVHPLALDMKFHDLVTIEQNATLSIETLETYEIPFRGVRELCFLHDIVEDTEISHNDIKELFYDCGFQEVFDNYIDEPLKLITHDKSEPYETYIAKVMTNPISALVKMLDLNDNLDLFGLSKFNESKANRAKKYLDYFKMINDKYHYLDKFSKARDAERMLAFVKDLNAVGGK